MVAAGAVIVVWAFLLLATNLDATNVIVVPASSAFPSDSGLNDVYVYDQNGNLVNDARLFDQNGNPLQLGSGNCQDGSIGSGADPNGPDANGNEVPWTYPLCPTDVGPFRSGPGPVSSAASGAASASPTVLAPSPPIDTAAVPTAAIPSK
jgi:hypothetical protein